jgi:hypothetical protein
VANSPQNVVSIAHTGNNGSSALFSKTLAPSGSSCPQILEDGTLVLLWHNCAIIGIRELAQFKRKIPYQQGILAYSEYSNGVQVFGCGGQSTP